MNFTDPTDRRSWREMMDDRGEGAVHGTADLTEDLVRELSVCLACCRGWHPGDPKPYRIGDRHPLHEFAHEHCRERIVCDDCLEHINEILEVLGIEA